MASASEAPRRTASWRSACENKPSAPAFVLTGAAGKARPQSSAERLGNGIGPSQRAASTCLQALEALEIIRNPPLQIVLRSVTELGARTRNIVDAGSRIGHAEEIQPGSDLDVGARKMLADDARDVVERDA